MADGLQTDWQMNGELDARFETKHRAPENDAIESILIQMPLYSGSVHWGTYLLARFFQRSSVELFCHFSS